MDKESQTGNGEENSKNSHRDGGGLGELEWNGVQIPLGAQLLLLSLAQTLGLLVGLSVSLLIVGVRV